MAFGYRPPGAGYGPPPTRHSANRSNPALIGTANYRPPAPTPPRHQYSAGPRSVLPWYRTPGYQTGYGDTVDYNPEPQYAGGVGPAIAASDYAMGQAYASDPSLAYYQGLQGILQSRAAGADAYLNQQSGYLNQNYAIDLAKQGLRLQGIDIDRAASGRDLEHLSLQEIIARQRHGLGIRGTNFDEADINRQAAGDMRRLNSDATARMAFTAPGVNEGRGEIRSAQQSAIDRLNTVTREGIHLDLNERLVGLWHQRDQVKDTGAKLDLAAKAVGLDKDSLKLQLEQGLARLSYDRVMNADQLIEGLFSTDAAIRQRSLDIAGQIMAQGLAGQLPAPPTAGSSGGGGGGPVAGVDDFMRRIAGVESGGNYSSRNSDSGAYGKYQIMPSNWPAWSREAGIPGAPQTPENQERVARFKMEQYYRTFGRWDAVAVAWYAGPGVAAQWVKSPYSSQWDKPQGGGKYPSINSYARKVGA